MLSDISSGLLCLLNWQFLHSRLPFPTLGQLEPVYLRQPCPTVILHVYLHTHGSDVDINRGHWWNFTSSVWDSPSCSSISPQQVWDLRSQTTPHSQPFFFTAWPTASHATQKQPWYGQESISSPTSVQGREPAQPEDGSQSPWFPTVKHCSHTLRTRQGLAMGKSRCCHCKLGASAEDSVKALGSKAQLLNLKPLCHCGSTDVLCRRCAC